MSLHAQVAFVDVAASTGTVVTSFGRGVAWTDLDRDGLPDLVCADAAADLAVFRQLPDHTFVDAFAAWGFPPDARSHWGVLAADLDNDGDDDLYVMNGGFTGRQPNQLLRNDLSSGGGFVDVSALSGDAALSASTFGGALVDFDRDGLVDVFLCNAGNQGCNLLRNEGGLVFRNVSGSAGIAESGGSYRHCSAGDVDNDGWPDLAVGNFIGANLLYRNQGDGTFAEIAAAAGIASPGENFGFVLEDFDNDGWMDAYVPKYQARPDRPSGLFVNRRDGTFLDVSTASGMPGGPDMGHNVADVDGDGYPDIFIGTGSPSRTMDDVLLLVVPDAATRLRVSDVSDASGIRSSGPSRCHGSSFADYDQDGDLDLFCNNGGPEDDPTTLEDDFFWQNQGNGNRWLEVDLRGVISNRSAVGARASVRTTASRDVHRIQSGGRGFGNTNVATLHFGLGSDPGIEEALVRWPSGIVQRVVDVPLDTRIEVIETGIRARGVPGVGEPFDVEACGPPGSVVDLWFATATDWRPIPHLGVLELADPLAFLATAVLDPSGRATLTIDVPDEPALIGRTFHLQACVRDPVEAMHGVLTQRLDATVR